jgi:hypothetical protein
MEQLSRNSREVVVMVRMQLYTEDDIGICDL